MKTRRYIRNLDDEAERARKIRETFVDRPATKIAEMKWRWPSAMVEAGQCLAVMYSSDKWKPRGNFEDYKHVAEDEQLVFVRPRFLVDEDGDPLDLAGPSVDVGAHMPTVVAVLAPIIGVQMRLYESGARGHYLPNGRNAYQVNIPKAMLAAAEHPLTREKFLIIYSPSEVLCLITGNSLDVLHDGIVG